MWPSQGLEGMEAKPPSYGGQSMVAPLRRVAVKRPEEAFRSPATIQDQWGSLGYTRAPGFEIACREHRDLVDLLEAAGTEVLALPDNPHTTLDSIYVHDPVLVTDLGAVLLRAGKQARRGEASAFSESFPAWGIPVLGAIDEPGTAEAGDMIWLDTTTLLVGQGFRTNEEGIRQLQVILKPFHIDVIPFHLPYGNGPGEVLHLMSFISLLDIDLAVTSKRLVPVPLYEILSERGIELVDIPEEEYTTQGCNVLALAPRNAIMIEGNPLTRHRLEVAGCRVSEVGTEICLPGAGGPTCLTRPLWRS
jgi:N-dimethylarginine dimethylaminohydrolase